MHPGIVNTGLIGGMDNAWWGKIFLCCCRAFIKTVFHGAQTSIYCALEDSIERHSGRYYKDCREAKPMRLALVEEDQRRLWEMSEKMVGIGVKEEEEPDQHSVVESLA